MTRAGATGARFRQRKLSTKQSLQILREDQVEKLDDDAQRNVPKVETGVEKGEEIEHHLQAAISASQAAAIGGKVAQIFIPTPDTIHSNIQYDRFYPLRFSQPSTYIRFSSTVEDCIGCSYCMSPDDERFLRTMNANRLSSSATSQAKAQIVSATPRPCSPLQFESVMDFFEETAKSKQPFASIDNAPVISYHELSSSFDETLDENSRLFAAEIYTHWAAFRSQNLHKALMPSLQYETGKDTDDADPYICFRRREVRQVRKTRGRDAQSTEKLRKLRRELEDARRLILSVKERERSRRDVLMVERTIFEQRGKVKETKRRLGIKVDNEDLITQKPQKKKIIDPVARLPGSTGPQLRMPARPDGRVPEMELIPLNDTLHEKVLELAREIDQKIAQHRVWNTGYLDLTRLPLLPIEVDPGRENFFRTAVAEYLPTPPTSASSDGEGDDEKSVVRPSLSHQQLTPLSSSPPGAPHCDNQNNDYRLRPAFRRRYGRGGRLFLDRRHLSHPKAHSAPQPLVSFPSAHHPSMSQRRNHAPLSPPDLDAQLRERFRFDQDSDDDETSEAPSYVIDRFDALSMRYRAGVFSGFPRMGMRVQGGKGKGGKGKGKGKGSGESSKNLAVTAASSVPAAAAAAALASQRG